MTEMTMESVPAQIAERNGVRVELSWIGEGCEGDFDPGDPEDQPLLRFDVSKFEDGSWEAVDDSSYCTQIPATTEPGQVMKIAERILDEVEDAVRSGNSIKRQCERLSWIGSDYGNPETPVAAPGF